MSGVFKIQNMSSLFDDFYGFLQAREFLISQLGFQFWNKYDGLRAKLGDYREGK